MSFYFTVQHFSSTLCLRGLLSISYGVWDEHIHESDDAAELTSFIGDEDFMCPVEEHVLHELGSGGGGSNDW